MTIPFCSFSPPASFLPPLSPSPPALKALHYNGKQRTKHSGIFKHVKAYSSISRHIQAYKGKSFISRHIKVYLACRYIQAYHIRKIFIVISPSRTFPQWLSTSLQVWVWMRKPGILNMLISNHQSILSES